MRRVLIDCIGEFAAEPREQIVPRQAGLFRQGVQHIRANRLLKLGRRQLFVGTRFLPRIPRFCSATLPKSGRNDFAEPATKNPAGTGTTENVSAGRASHRCRLVRGLGRALSYSAEHFGDLVPVLVARDWHKSIVDGANVARFFRLCWFFLLGATLFWWP